MPAPFVSAPGGGFPRQATRISRGGTKVLLRFQKLPFRNLIQIKVIASAGAPIVSQARGAEPNRRNP